MCSQENFHSGLYSQKYFISIVLIFKMINVTVF
jgi:hypothetical protein